MLELKWILDLKKYETSTIKSGDWQLNYPELINSSITISYILKKLGLNSQECVVIIMKNTPGLVASILGVFLNQSVIVPLYFDLPLNLIKDILKRCLPRILIVDDIAKKKELLELVSDIGIGCICIGHNTENRTVSINILANPRPTYSVRVYNDGVCEILFTSGSTGPPKGVLLTYNNLSCCIEGISNYIGINCTDIILITKPLAHSSSINGELFLGLSLGASIVLDSNLLLTSRLVNMIEKEKITVFFTVPTILELLRKSDMFKRLNDKSELRIIHFYGAPASEDLVKKILMDMPTINIFYGYGLTEASPRVTYIEKNNLLSNIKSSGKAISGVDIKIYLEDGNIANIYERGEIVVSGPTIMKGYLDEEDLTAIKLKDGNLHTGDIGWIDDNGYLYVCGRMDDMINRGGLNIYPTEIENILLENPDITAAVVIGEYDSISNNKIVAYVELSDDSMLTVADIVRLCRKKLDPRKVPTVINIVDHLERTISGKIKRRIINKN